jgi:hypothetical protein
VKRRRRFFLVAATLPGAALAIASACGFPEPTLVDPGSDGGPGGDSNPGDDGPVPQDATLADSVFGIDGNQNVDPDGGSQESSVAPEASLIDANGCVSCNCDGDDAASEAGTCGGNDCNDLDPFIPHDGYVKSKPVGHSGDWNCDGIVTKQFPVNVDCGLLANCKTAGFTGDPACGTAGEFVTCKELAIPLSGVLCQKGATETVIQACK